MTTAVAPRESSVAAPRAAAAVAAAGCGLLLLRPVLIEHLSHPAALLATLFVGLAVIGLAWPSTTPPRLERAAVPLAVGVAAFAVGRVAGGGHPPTTAVGVALLGNPLAAVAEEAFFRRFLSRLLEPHGPGVAVVGTAALFAAVHVTVYGLW